MKINNAFSCQFLLTLSAVCGFSLSLPAQAPENQHMSRRQRPHASDGVVSLKPTRFNPALGFEVARAGIVRGTVKHFDFESKVVGETFTGNIYLPPGFSPFHKFPVLYLLHGASGDESTWLNEIHAAAILDNLYADRKIVPMLVVMPSSLSHADRQHLGQDRRARAQASEAFSDVLLHDLIPFIESQYPAVGDREHRAIAGMSMGGSLALNIGLRNPDHFAWIGAFSGAGAQRLPNSSLAILKEPLSQPILLWLSVGDRDRLSGSSVLAAVSLLRERKIPHVFHVNPGGHEPRVWMNDLYYFSQEVFKL